MVLLAGEQLYKTSEPFRNWVHRTFDQVKGFVLRRKDRTIAFYRSLPRWVQFVLSMMAGPAIFLVFIFIWLSQAIRLFVLKKITITLLKKPILKVRKNHWVRHQVSKQKDKLVAAVKRRKKPKEGVLEEKNNQISQSGSDRS